MIKNSRVLVTGAGGFIGSHLVERLVVLGADVRAFVRYNSRGDIGALALSPAGVMKNVEIIMGDLRDSEAIRQAVKGVSTIFHLGALIGIPYSYVHPREVVDTNVIGSFNILTAARDSGTEKIVHTSTSEVYGTAKYVPIDEDHPLQGQSPYSASKIGADMIASSFYRSFDLPVAIVRPFNNYGPRQSARAVIPTIISQVLTKDKISLGSLHTTRDYVYVTDTVDGFIKAAESPEAVGEVINIGSNFEVSIGDVAKMVMSLTGKNREIVLDPLRVRPSKSEVERLWCDNSKAKRLLGWEPSVSFREGIERTIKWVSENENLFSPTVYSV